MRLGAKQILYHDICALSHDLLNCDNGGLAGDTTDIRASFDPHETILAPWLGPTLAISGHTTNKWNIVPSPTFGSAFGVVASAPPKIHAKPKPHWGRWGEEGWGGIQDYIIERYIESRPFPPTLP